MREIRYRSPWYLWTGMPTGGSLLQVPAAARPFPIPKRHREVLPSAQRICSRAPRVVLESEQHPDGRRFAAAARS